MRVYAWYMVHGAWCTWCTPTHAHAHAYTHAHAHSHEPHAPAPCSLLTARSPCSLLVARCSLLVVIARRCRVVVASSLSLRRCVVASLRCSVASLRLCVVVVASSLRRCVVVVVVVVSLSLLSLRHCRRCVVIASLPLLSSTHTHAPTLYCASRSNSVYAHACSSSSRVQRLRTHVLLFSEDRSVNKVCCVSSGLVMVPRPHNPCVTCTPCSLRSCACLGKFT